MTSPKKAEWRTVLRAIGYANINEGVIEAIISQTHTELCTTLKERVEEAKQEMLRRGRVLDYADRTEFDECAEILDKVLTLIDQLLVTDEKV